MNTALPVVNNSWVQLPFALQDEQNSSVEAWNMQNPFLNTLGNHPLPAEPMQQNEEAAYELNAFMQNEYYAPNVIQTQQNLWTESDEQATNYTNFLLQQQAEVQKQQTQLSRRTSTLGTLPKTLPLANYLQRHLVLTSNGLAPPFREREKLNAENEFDDNSQKTHSINDSKTTNNVISNPYNLNSTDAKKKQQPNVEPFEIGDTEHNAQRTYPGLARKDSIQDNEYTTHFSNVGSMYWSANCFLDDATSFYKINSVISPSTKNQSTNFINNREIGNVPNSFYYKPGSFYNLQLNKDNSMYNNNNDSNEQNLDLLPYSASSILHANSQRIRLGLVRKASITNFSYSFRYLGEDDVLQNDEEETAKYDFLYTKQTAPIQYLELEEQKHRKVVDKYEVQQSKKFSHSKEERKRNAEEELEEQEEFNEIQKQKVKLTPRKDNQESGVSNEQNSRSVNQSKYLHQGRNKLNSQLSQKEMKQRARQEELYAITESSELQDKESTNAKHAEIDWSESGVMPVVCMIEETYNKQKLNNNNNEKSVIVKVHNKNKKSTEEVKQNKFCDGVENRTDHEFESHKKNGVTVEVMTERSDDANGDDDDKENQRLQSYNVSEVVTYDRSKSECELPMPENVNNVMEHFFNGDSSALLIASDVESNTLPRKLIDQVGHALFDANTKEKKVEQHTTRYITVSASALFCGNNCGYKNPQNGKCIDLLQNTPSSKVALSVGSLPLSLGPALMNMSWQSVSDETEWQELLNRLVSKFDTITEDAVLYAQVILVQTTTHKSHKQSYTNVDSKSENINGTNIAVVVDAEDITDNDNSSSEIFGDNANETVVISNLLITVSNCGNSVYTRIAKQDGSLHFDGLFRYAIGGPSATVHIVCMQDCATCASTLLKNALILASIRNTVPINGNVQNFINATEAKYDKCVRLSNLHSESKLIATVHEQIKRYQLMLNDAEELIHASRSTRLRVRSLEELPNSESEFAEFSTSSEEERYDKIAIDKVTQENQHDESYSPPSATHLNESDEVELRESNWHEQTYDTLSQISNKNTPNDNSNNNNHDHHHVNTKLESKVNDNRICTVVLTSANKCKEFQVLPRTNKIICNNDAYSVDEVGVIANDSNENSVDDDDDSNTVHKAVDTHVIESVIDKFLHGYNAAVLALSNAPNNIICANAADNVSIANFNKLLSHNTNKQHDVWTSKNEYSWTLIRRVVERALNEKASHKTIKIKLALLRLPERQSNSNAEVLDLLQDSLWSHVILSASPLFGPTVHNISEYTISELTDLEFIVNRATRNIGGECANNTVIYFFMTYFHGDSSSNSNCSENDSDDSSKIDINHKLPTNVKDGVVSSFMASFAGPNANIYENIITGQSALQPLYRYACGGTAAVGCVVFLSNDSDATCVNKLLSLQRQIASRPNKPLRYGSIREFVKYTQKLIEQRRVKLQTALDKHNGLPNRFINNATNATGSSEVSAHNAAIERAMAPMMKMLHDHELCLSNPEKYFPQAYVTETAPNVTKYPTISNTHTITESNIIKSNNNDNMIMNNSEKTKNELNQEIVAALPTTLNDRSTRTLSLNSSVTSLSHNNMFGVSVKMARMMVITSTPELCTTSTINADDDSISAFPKFTFTLNGHDEYTSDEVLVVPPTDNMECLYTSQTQSPFALSNTSNHIAQSPYTLQTPLQVKNEEMNKVKRVYKEYIAQSECVRALSRYVASSRNCALMSLSTIHIPLSCEPVWQVLLQLAESIFADTHCSADVMFAIITSDTVYTDLLQPARLPTELALQIRSSLLFGSTIRGISLRHVSSIEQLHSVVESALYFADKLQPFVMASQAMVFCHIVHRRQTDEGDLMVASVKTALAVQSTQIFTEILESVDCPRHDILHEVFDGPYTTLCVCNINAEQRYSTGSITTESENHSIIAKADSTALRLLSEICAKYHNIPSSPGSVRNFVKNTQLNLKLELASANNAVDNVLHKSAERYSSSGANAHLRKTQLERIIADHQQLLRDVTMELPSYPVATSTNFRQTEKSMTRYNVTNPMLVSNVFAESKIIPPTTLSEPVKSYTNGRNQQIPKFQIYQRQQQQQQVLQQQQQQQLQQQRQQQWYRTVNNNNKNDMLPYQSNVNNQWQSAQPVFATQQLLYNQANQSVSNIHSVAIITNTRQSLTTTAASSRKSPVSLSSHTSPTQNLQCRIKITGINEFVITTNDHSNDDNNHNNNNYNNFNTNSSSGSIQSDKDKIINKQSYDNSSTITNVINEQICVDEVVARHDRYSPIRCNYLDEFVSNLLNGNNGSLLLHDSRASAMIVPVTRKVLQSFMDMNNSPHRLSPYFLKNRTNSHKLSNSSSTNNSGSTNEINTPSSTEQQQQNQEQKEELSELEKTPCTSLLLPSRELYAAVCVVKDGMVWQSSDQTYTPLEFTESFLQLGPLFKSVKYELTNNLLEYITNFTATVASAMEQQTLCIAHVIVKQVIASSSPVYSNDIMLSSLFIAVDASLSASFFALAAQNVLQSRQYQMKVDSRYNESVKVLNNAIGGTTQTLAIIGLPDISVSRADEVLSAVNAFRQLRCVQNSYNGNNTFVEMLQRDDVSLQTKHIVKEALADAFGWVPPFHINYEM